MMSLTFGLFTQVSGSGHLGPLVDLLTSHRFASDTTDLVLHLVKLVNQSQRGSDEIPFQ